MYRKITLLLVLIGVAIPLQAQEQNEEGGNSPSVEERLNVLEEEIERLRLEKATKQYEGHHGMGPAASEVYHIGEGLSWGGYGEVKYRDYRSKYKTDQTDVHRFILYAGYRFNDWILLNAEIEYEHAGFEEETVAGSTVNSGEVFVEFAYIDLQFTEWAQLALGLNLVPVGITNYRHEPTTFLPSERSQTESNIIPSTWREVGAILHGDIGSFMTYRTGIMTGPRGAKFSESSWIRGGRTKGSKARSEDFAYVLGLDFYPYEGWTVGGAYYMGDSGQREIAEINWTDRLSDPLSGSDTTGLKTALSDIRNNRHKDARVRVHIAEGHLEYDYGPVKMRALLARGWMNERDARAVNRATGNNVGQVVEGAYGEVGFNVLSFFQTTHRLYPFVRYEYINTQKETVRRYNGGSEDVQDFICANVLAGSCKTTAQLTNQNQDLGIIAASDSFKEAYGVTGVADRVNDRRIVTIGLAYFPVDQVVLKADYERWESKTDYHTDIAGRNPDNNKVDRFNFAVGFIF